MLTYNVLVVEKGKEAVTYTKNIGEID